jgi:uncharacterized membrane protein
MNQFVLMGAMAFAAVCGGLGQVMMKRASGIPLLKALPFLAAFAALYGVGVIINYLVYRAGGSVSILYPVISLSYVVAAFFAWKFLGEPMSWVTLTGIGIIMVGIGVIGYGAS